jgi:hypothetical protein
MDPTHKEKNLNLMANKLDIGHIITNRDQQAAQDDCDHIIKA